MLKLWIVQSNIFYHFRSHCRTEYVIIVISTSEGGLTIKSSTNIKSEVQKLLDSDMTGYEIERRTGITRSTIHYLRRGKRSIDNLSSKNAEKLYELSKSIQKETKQ